MFDSRRVPAAASLAILLTVCVGPTDASESPAPVTGSARLTTEDLPGLVLTEADLPGGLAGFVERDAKSIPNEVRANTGGDGEPVTLDDPDYGENLDRLNAWGRLGGYGVTFTRQRESGQPYEIQVGLDLTDSDEGAHDLYTGWFASEPNQCLEVGDESDCPSLHISLLLVAADGTEELLTSRSATFRAGRLIGEVDVWATSGPDDELGPALEGIARSLAVRLFDKVQGGVTTPSPPMSDPIEPPSQPASSGPSPEPTPVPTAPPSPEPAQSPTPLPSPEMADGPGPPTCVPAPADPFSVGSVVWDASFSFIGGYVAAQEETASCLGIELDVQDGQRDPATQTAAIERFIEQGKDLIIVSSGNPAELAPVIRDANDAGIPVVAALMPVDDDAEVVTFVGYDDDAIGSKQGEMVVAAVGEEARVGLILGAGRWYAPIEKGLTDYLDDHPGIEIVERQVTEGDEAGLLAVTEEWLATYPPGELAGIVVQGFEVVSAAQLVADQGRSDVKIFAGWYTDTVDEAITDGRIHGTILQDPRPIGAASIEDAFHWLTGDRDAVERPEHFLAPTIVTIANVDEYPAWEARPAPIPAPTATAEPEPTPSPRPLTIGDLDRQAYRMCVRARPDDLYRIKARVAPAKAARGMDTAHLVLVEYRDLRGVQRREPRIKADSVYDLRWNAPFDWRSAGDIDVLACLALRATRRETWRHTTTLAPYTIDAADAILWMVDATDGKMIGRAWLRRPRPTASAPVLSSSEVLVGKRGPGIRPPPADSIIRDVRRFLRR
jgi:ABC-type sugar transport system substrate-binding protein